MDDWTNRYIWMTMQNKGVEVKTIIWLIIRKKLFNYSKKCFLQKSSYEILKLRTVIFN